MHSMHDACVSYGRGIATVALAPHLSVAALCYDYSDARFPAKHFNRSDCERLHMCAIHLTARCNFLQILPIRLLWAGHHILLCQP